MKHLPKLDNFLTLRKNSMNFIPKEKDKDQLIWMDLEMTGLDSTRDHILEIACLITDGHLNPINEGINLVIHQPDEVLDRMNPWCVEQHGKTGLTVASRESTVSITMAETQLLSYVRQYTAPGQCPIAGNTIHEDKKFISKYLPELVNHFHYRIVDVSTIKELCRRWYPEEFKNAPKKNFAHRALDDIFESIAELQYYRKAIFKQ